MHAEIWLQTTPADFDAAERSFSLAVQKARGHAALSLELRSAMRLARLWSARGKCLEAANRLEGVYALFTEGYQTTDLKLGRQVLAELGRCTAPLDPARSEI